MRDKLIDRIRDRYADLDLCEDLALYKANRLEELSNNDLLEILIDLEIDNFVQVAADAEIGPPTWVAGDRVMVCGKYPGTIVQQYQSEGGWGNVHVRYDDGKSGTSNSWQCQRIENNLAM